MKSRNTGGTWTNNVYKIGNIDITVNSDGTIKLNGTSNNQFEFYIYTRVSDTFKLPVGTYMFNNSLTASTGGKWDIAINRTVSGAGMRYGSDTGNGLLFTVTDASATTGVWIACNVSGTVFNNVIIKPMICTKAAFGVSSKFVPYRPNYDLVGSMALALNSPTLTVPTKHSNITSVRSGGYFRIGNIVIVNIVCTVGTELPLYQVLFTGLPTPVTSSSLSAGDGVAVLSTNKNCVLSLTKAGQIINYESAIETGGLEISGVYICS